MCLQAQNMGLITLNEVIIMKPEIKIHYLFIILFLSLNINIVYSQKKEAQIAMAQILCLDGDRSGNFVRIENAIMEAKEMGADIVCFPETSLFGWVNPVAHTRAYPIPGPDSDRLCVMAINHNIYICIGLAEKDGDKLYDSAILVDNRGNIILKHRKINILTELMSPPYTAGSDIKTVETKFGTIGMLICADSFEDKILNRMSDQHPDIVLIPYGWANSEESWPGHSEELSRTVRNAAKEIGCYVIGTDLVGEISHGPWKGLVYGGSSVTSDRYGEIIGQCRDRDRDVVLVNIEL